MCIMQREQNLLYYIKNDILPFFWPLTLFESDSQSKITKYVFPISFSWLMNKILSHGQGHIIFNFFYTHNVIHSDSNMYARSQAANTLYIQRSINNTTCIMHKYNRFQHVLYMAWHMNQLLLSSSISVFLYLPLYLHLLCGINKIDVSCHVKLRD